MSARYNTLYKPTHPNATKDGRIQEHVFVMTEMLGRALTALEVVHHRDEDKKNNALDNLMLFATQAEHQLYHAEQRALKACGNSTFMKCYHCKEYDDPANMAIRKAKRQAYHRECHAVYMSKHREAAKAITTKL
jgi:hypothetical protein